MKLTVVNNQMTYKSWTYPMYNMCGTSDEHLFYVLTKVYPDVNYQEFLKALRELEKEYW